MAVDYTKLEALPSDPIPKTPFSEKKKPGRPPKSNIQRELEAEFEAYLKLIAFAWAGIDDYCPGVLNKQSHDISESLCEILVKHPGLVEKLQKMTGITDYMKLFTSVLPVITAIRVHHIAPSFQKEEMPEQEEQVSLEDLMPPGDAA